MASKYIPHLWMSCLVLCALVSTGWAIHCWDCSSHINPGCGDYFSNNSFAMIDCDQKIMPHLAPQKATLCRKIIQKVENDPRPRIIRSCGWIKDHSINGACLKRSGTFSVLMEYCTCDSDGCNGASHLKGHHLMVIVPLVLMMTGFFLSGSSLSASIYL